MKTMKKINLKWLALLFMGILSVGLASCGDDDDDDNMNASLQGVWEITEYYGTEYYGGSYMKEYKSLEESGHDQYLILEKSGGGWHYTSNSQEIQDTERFYKWEFKNGNLILYYHHEDTYMGHTEVDEYEDIYKASYDGSNTLKLEFQDDVEYERMTLTRMK